MTLIRCFFMLVLSAATLAAAAQGHMNVQRSSYGDDPNKLLLNPQWKCQQLNNCPPDPQRPDADALCDEWPVPRKCVTQAFNVDRPTNFFKKTICSFEPNSKIHGHVNLQPVTFYGKIEWEGLSSDFDFNFALTPARGHGLTIKKTSIHSEFDSRETLMKFKKLPGWWGEFLAAGRDKVRAAKMIGSEDANGVLTGLFGLDCEHNCSPELHPIYLLGIRVPGSSADPEKWVVLARNSGNEGFCSSRRHPIGRNELHLLLPNRVASLVGKPVFYGTSKTIKAPVVTPVAGVGVLLTFNVKDREVIVGEIQMKRSPTGGIASFALPRMGAEEAYTAEKAEEREERDSAESLLLRLIERAPVKVDASAYAPEAVAALDDQPADELTPVIRPTITSARYRERVRRTGKPSYGPAAEDPEQLANDERIRRELCAAYDGNLPDPRLKDACKED